MAGLTWRDIDPGADTPDRMRRNWQILREVLRDLDERKLEDAPDDHQLYGRKDAQWSVIEVSNGD